MEGELDLRLPMGLLFSVLGTVLAIYGLFADTAIYKRSLGVNINLGWVVVMLLFGLLMLLLYWIGRPKKDH